MRRRLLIVLLGATCGCAHVARLRSSPPAVLPLAGDAVPRGTLASAQLRQPLSTDKSRPGDRFTLELLDPLTDGQGREVVGRGALVEGVVQRADGSFGFAGPASLELSLVGVEAPGEGVVSLPAEVASAPLSTGSGLLRGLAAGFVGAAAGAGTGLAVDHQDAAVVVGSSIVGAGVGALLSYLFGPKEAVLPSGSVVTLRLTGDFRPDHPIATVQSPAPCRLPAREAEARPVH